MISTVVSQQVDTQEFEDKNGKEGTVMSMRQITEENVTEEKSGQKSKDKSGQQVKEEKAVKEFKEDE